MLIKTAVASVDRFTLFIRLIINSQPRRPPTSAGILQ